MSPGEVFVITIDGPSGAGKGTVAQRIAANLGFNLLDSGAVYRAAALNALDQSASLEDERAIVDSMNGLPLRFEQGSNNEIQVLLGGKNVTAELRSERSADAASRIAVMPQVRKALLQIQRDFARPPGLVADGRDMGTVVFPDAQLKVFLTASTGERAQRRYNQLIEKGLDAKLGSLMQEIEARDLRDSTRKNAPLVAADDALVIDSTAISIEQVATNILQEVAERRGATVP